jgi:hypothetical protein
MAQIQFETKLSGDGSSVSYVEIPKSVMAHFEGRKRVKVKASLNGFTYRTTTFSMQGCCGIPVRREIREGAGIEPGDRIKVKLEEDLRERKVTIPSDLLKALKSSPKIHDRFTRLSYTLQKEHVNWVIGAKKSETRTARIIKIIEKVKTEKQHKAVKTKT